MIFTLLAPTIMSSLETSTGNPSAGLWFIIVLAVIGGALAWGLRGSTRESVKVTVPNA